MSPFDHAGGGVLAALEACFERIGRESMKGLPFYNEALAVEAVGSHRVGDDRICVLVTPWFMNLIVAAETPAPFDADLLGGKRTIVLPAGETVLVAGGHEDFGMYHAHSFVSPMDRFTSQAQARAAAQAALASLFTPRVADDDASAKPAEGPSRRTLFVFSKSAAGTAPAPQA